MGLKLIFMYLKTGVQNVRNFASCEEAEEGRGRRRRRRRTTFPSSTFIRRREKQKADKQEARDNEKILPKLPTVF